MQERVLPIHGEGARKAPEGLPIHGEVAPKAPEGLRHSDVGKAPPHSWGGGAEGAGGAPHSWGGGAEGAGGAAAFRCRKGSSPFMGRWRRRRRRGCGIQM